MDYRAICGLDCEFSREFDDSRAAAAAAREHMWDAHRLAVDPLDAGDFVLPARSGRSS